MKNFEQRLSRLEEISEKIREPELGLEDAFALFEEGVNLSKGLEKDMDKIESKVEILLNKPTKEEDEPKLGLFDEEE